MKREPIYDKETRTLYGLNPMELDALKQRFSMRASPQEDSLEQDDVPGQDGWRKDGWREDDWGRDGWREDTWDKDGWDNDGWREDGSGNDDWGKDWREDSENSWDNIGKTSRDMRKQEQPGDRKAQAIGRSSAIGQIQMNQALPVFRRAPHSNTPACETQWKSGRNKRRYGKTKPWT